MVSFSTRFILNFRFRGLVLLPFLILLSCPPGFSGDKIENFTADYVSIGPKGDITGTSKTFFTPNGIRIDGLIGPQNVRDMPKRDISLLCLKDKHKQYLINHDKKIYAVMDFGDQSMGIKDFKQARMIKVLGEEGVSGYDCIKKLVSNTFKVMGMTMTHKSTIWVSDRFDMPLRTKSEKGNVMEFRNIDPGMPGKAHFRLPSGYKKVDSVMTVMGINMGHHGSMHQTITGSKKDTGKLLQELKNKFKGLKF